MGFVLFSKGSFLSHIWKDYPLTNRKRSSARSGHRLSVTSHPPPQPQNSPMGPAHYSCRNMHHGDKDDGLGHAENYFAIHFSSY